MKIFSKLYDVMMGWAKHPHAPRYLSVVSFAESSFFPFPPDFMLAPMVLARPQNAWSLALLTTMMSVLGGLFGYLLGHYFVGLIHPLFVAWGYEPLYQHILLWFHQWGFWIIFLAGFSPIPYKLFTVAAGVFGLALLPFTIASFVGRGGRFFLVAGLLKWGGARFESLWRPYLDYIGWVLVAILAGIGVFLCLR